MESEKVKEIKRVLEEEPFNTIKHHKKEGGWIVLSFQEILTLINELESENEALQKGVKRLKKRYEETITKNADECVKKFCETTMYHEHEKLVNENQQLKNRIAELETKNEVLCVELSRYTENCVEMKNGTLKQFAERLIEKKVKLGERFNIYDIDETLKEFVNEKK